MKDKIKYSRIIKILLISTFTGFLYNFISPDGLTLIREKTKLVAASDSLLFSQQSEKANDNFTMISTSQAKELFNSRKAIFIDARDHWDFSDGHIPGSINIPEYDFEPSDSTVNAMDKTQRYVVYCHGTDCDVALRLAKELRKLKFNNLLIYADGWSAWINKGFAVEKGN